MEFERGTKVTVTARFKVGGDAFIPASAILRVVAKKVVNRRTATVLLILTMVQSGETYVGTIDTSGFAAGPHYWTAFSPEAERAVVSGDFTIKSNSSNPFA